MDAGSLIVGSTETLNPLTTMKPNTTAGNWNSNYYAYKCIAVVSKSLNANTARRLAHVGGQVLETEIHDSRTTPTYLAQEQMQDEYPNCDITIIPSRAWRIQHES